MGYHYCGNKIEVFEKQGTSYWVARDKAEMLYVEMADYIQKYRTKMNGNWLDADMQILANLLRNKDALLEATEDKVISKMLETIYEVGFEWAELENKIPLWAYEEKVLDQYLFSRKQWELKKIKFTGKVSKDYWVK